MNGPGGIDNPDVSRSSSPPLWNITLKKIRPISIFSPILATCSLKILICHWGGAISTVRPSPTRSNGPTAAPSKNQTDFARRKAWIQSMCCSWWRNLSRCRCAFPFPKAHVRPWMLYFFAWIQLSERFSRFRRTKNRSLYRFRPFLFRWDCGCRKRRYQSGEWWAACPQRRGSRWITQRSDHLMRHWALLCISPLLWSVCSCDGRGYWVWWLPTWFHSTLVWVWSYSWVFDLFSEAISSSIKFLSFWFLKRKCCKDWVLGTNWVNFHICYPISKWEGSNVGYSYYLANLICSFISKAVC